MAPPVEPLARPGLRGSRLVSAAELLLGTAVVLGHSVWKVVPNEVPILFVRGLASYRLREGALSAIGSRRPESWVRTVAIAAGAAALRIGLGEQVVDSRVARLVPACAYLLARRSLWVPVLAHGFIDTVGVVALRVGLAD